MSVKAQLSLKSHRIFSLTVCSNQDLDKVHALRLVDVSLSLLLSTDSPHPSLSVCVSLCNLFVEEMKSFVLWIFCCLDLADCTPVIYLSLFLCSLFSYKLVVGWRFDPIHSCLLARLIHGWTYASTRTCMISSHLSFCDVSSHWRSLTRFINSLGGPWVLFWNNYKQKVAKIV